jgi:Fe-S cluster assembly ATP-binding protein
MGPNGAGKSTLAYTLGGRPGYDVTGGSVDFDGADLLAMDPHERAAAGLFLASSIRWKSPACPTCSSCARR